MSGANQKRALVVDLNEAFDEEPLVIEVPGVGVIGAVVDATCGCRMDFEKMERIRCERHRISNHPERKGAEWH